MSLTYLVDTDWIVHYLNGRQDIVERLDVLKHQGLGLSTVSLGELYEGVYYSRDLLGDEHGLQAFLQGVTLLSLDEETAKIFGRQRGRLRADGLLIGDADLWIAATALQYNLTLLTNNRRHFERIDRLCPDAGVGRNPTRAVCGNSLLAARGAVPLTPHRAHSGVRWILGRLSACLSGARPAGFTHSGAADSPPDIHGKFASHQGTRTRVASKVSSNSAIGSTLPGCKGSTPTG